MSLFDTLRTALANGLGPELLEATLVKVTGGTRTPGAQSAGTNPTTASYACRASVKSWAAQQIDGTIVKADDALIGILGGTIANDAIPETNDKIVIAGATWKIVGGREGKGVTRIGVNADGLAAVYRCHARRMPT